MTPDQIRALFARRNEAYARQDAAALAADYADDCVVESPVAGVHVGRMTIERAFRVMFSAFPDLSMQTDELLICDNRVVQTVKFQGTDNGGFMGLPPTGKPFSTSVIFLYTFGNHHEIVHERRIDDFSRLLLQLAGEAGPATEGPQLYRETLERARQEQELKIAAEIQRALCPQSQHRGIGFEVAATSVPCRAIGGDFVDYFNLSNDGEEFGEERLLSCVRTECGLTPTVVLECLLEAVHDSALARRRATIARFWSYAIQVQKRLRPPMTWAANTALERARRLFLITNKVSPRRAAQREPLGGCQQPLKNGRQRLHRIV